MLIGTQRLSGGATLKLGGIDVTNGDTIAVASIGTLVFAPAADDISTSTFTFAVQDNGGTANSGVDTDQSANTMTLNVTSINDAPAGADNTFAVLEDGSKTFAAADFGFTDVNDSPANILLNVIIGTQSLSGGATLKLGGIDVTDGDPIAAATIGTLVFAPAADDISTSTFTFAVQDNGGTANSGVDTDQSANTMTLNVTSINDAPAGADNTFAVLEDGSKTFAAADFGFTDPNDTASPNILLNVISDPMSGSGPRHARPSRRSGSAARDPVPSRPGRTRCGCSDPARTRDPASPRRERPRRSPGWPIGASDREARRRASRARRSSWSPESCTRSRSHWPRRSFAVPPNA